MNEQLIGHLAIAFSAILPLALLYLLNMNRTKDFFGYNTPRGLKSQETREFSVKYATKGMFWAGLATLAAQVTFYFLIPGETGILLSSLVLTVALIVVLILTEVQLAARFDDEGKPKKMRPRY